jgi:hypothetical protein
MHPYDHFLPYLCSNKLHWSNAALSNGAHDWWSWQNNIVKQPLKAQVETLALAGFKGLWVDCFGYQNPEDELMQLKQLLNCDPLRSDDHRYAYFNLNVFTDDLKNKLGEAEFKRKSSRILGTMMTQTPLSSDAGGDTFLDLPQKDLFLAGLILGFSSDKRQVQSLCSLYSDNTEGLILGQTRGVARNLEPYLIQAKAGYAIGSIWTRNHPNLVAVKAVFMRIVNGKLNPNDNYESDWLGGKEGSTSLLDGQGKAVIGLRGQCSPKSVLSLGLILSDDPLLDAGNPGTIEKHILQEGGPLTVLNGNPYVDACMAFTSALKKDQLYELEITYWCEGKAAPFIYTLPAKAPFTIHEPIPLVHDKLTLRLSFAPVEDNPSPALMFRNWFTEGSVHVERWVLRSVRKAP